MAERAPAETSPELAAPMPKGAPTTATRLTMARRIIRREGGNAVRAVARLMQDAARARLGHGIDAPLYTFEGADLADGQQIVSAADVAELTAYRAIGKVTDVQAIATERDTLKAADAKRSLDADIIAAGLTPEAVEVARAKGFVIVIGEGKNDKNEPVRVASVRTADNDKATPVAWNEWAGTALTPALATALRVAPAGTSETTATSFAPRGGAEFFRQSAAHLAPAKAELTPEETRRAKAREGMYASL